MDFLLVQFHFTTSQNNNLRKVKFYYYNKDEISLAESIFDNKELEVFCVKELWDKYK